MKRWREASLNTVAVACALAIALIAVSLHAYLANVTKAKYPEATGETVYNGSGVTIDASNASDGYLMVKASRKKKLKLRIAKGDGTYTYDLPSGEYQVFPLQLGSGTYQVTVFEQVRGSQYAQLFAKKVKAALSDEYSYALYPSQYVPYDASYAAVAKSNELAKGLADDAAITKAVIDYVAGTVLYDHILAKTVQSGYLPDPDATLSQKKGICFDYAALVACMLRVQGIKCKLVIGYADKYYHAWNEVLLGDEWVRYDTTSMVTGLKVVKYTTERFY
jgi:transglutaminase-like putative cysteine protease